ncbi:MAG: TraB/GumN family protein [Pseudomonadota bacterium]|nr:TraB/GumN family protein [Pseudomonadota bacterium]
MRILSIIGMLGFAVTAAAQSPPSSPALATTTPPATASSITTLETVNITGVLPGPGLWKVSRGDHVLWVLGVMPSLPAGMQWRPAEVAQTIAGSQEVIASPSIKLKLDTNFFGKLFLLPSAFGARKNPDGKTLRDVLPPPLYARWLVQKQKYLGNDDGIERWRPIFAALQLYKKALKQNGLRSSGKVEDTVTALAKQRGLTPASTQFTLEVREPRQAIRAFEAAGPDGVACFARTLDSIEHDIPALRARANAWANGDLAALRQLPDSRFRDVCKSAITGAGFARQLGISNLPAQVEALWLNVAHAALTRNPQSFAVLPMDAVMDADGYLAALRSQGYTVVAPDQEDDAAPASAASGASAH